MSPYNIHRPTKNKTSSMYFFFFTWSTGNQIFLNISFFVTPYQKETYPEPVEYPHDEPKKFRYKYN